MASKNPDAPLSVNQRLDRIQTYVDANKQRLSIVALVIAVVVGGFLTYKYWYVPSQESDAEVAIRYAQFYFREDSINRAIKGDGANPGFLDIADQYSSTNAGKLANYYLGICYYKKKDYKQAIDYLEKFDADDVMVSANAKGVEGDAEMQLGNTDNAINDYLAAVKMSNNDYTAPLYTKKAGLAYELKGDFNNALTMYNNIKTQYYGSFEATDIEKYITRVEAKGGK